MGPAEYRLLVVSSRARNKVPIFNSVLPTLVLVDYNYETTTLEDLMSKISKALNGTKVASMAFVLHTSERELFICAPGSACVSLKTLINDSAVKGFFQELAKNILDLGNWSCRVDFLATYAAENLDGALIAKEVTALIGCQVGLSKDLFGSDVEAKTESGKAIPIGELYFDANKLRSHLQNVGKVGKEGAKKLLNYEKIRVVGKGAFGNAVLYRKKEDGLMCIIKEINMLDLNANDRQMALNEVKVLSQMDHPHIIAYHDSFEKDGILMIEMEYADGVNLAEFLAKQTSRMEEKDILDILYQMVSAIRYMHARHVLHRDLKTANIFLTREGTVKIGDFGISKIMTTRASGAHTVLGTPYYISPEMCEGKGYDEKSDIWALGCIVYEMAALQKTFEGSNLPALVNKIMKGQFAPIRGQYSDLFKKLVRDLLQRDPAFRPTATTIMLEWMPKLLAQFENRFGYYDGNEQSDEGDDLLTISSDERSKVKTSRRPTRSVLYYMKGYESSISLTPVQLPPRSRVLQVAVSSSHIVALTSEFLVFTWGDGRRGQLGHGELETWRSRPAAVESLKAKSITKVGAGNGFSLFASDNGIVMTCGDGTLGCLGHGDWQSLTIPKLVEALLSVDVSAVACGPEHVVVVGLSGDVYAWGRGHRGRLGLGHEDDCCSPQEVTAINTDEVYVVNVFCSEAATIFLSDSGALFACGENNENRLGLDTPKYLGCSSDVVESVLVPTKIKSIKHRIVSVAMGPFHTVCLTETGKVITMGQNSDAQLGRGHARSYTRSWPEVVKSMEDKEVSLVGAGSSFTIVGTNENVVYLWGTRYVSPNSRPNTREVFSQSFGSRMATPSDTPLSESDVHTMMNLESLRKEMSTGLHKQLLMDSSKREAYEKTIATLSSSALMRHQSEITLKDVVTEPQEILALFASAKQQEKGEIVMLRDLKSTNQNIFLTVDTTCPLPRSDRPPTPCIEEFEPLDQVNSREVVIDMNHVDKQQQQPSRKSSRSKKKRHSRKMDQSEIPHWLKEDLEEGFKKNYNNNHAKEGSEKLEKRAPTSVDQEHIKKMQREYELKRKELLLEAENVVRMREEAYNQELMKLQSELEKQKRLQEEHLERLADASKIRPKMAAAASGCVIQ